MGRKKFDPKSFAFTPRESQIAPLVSVGMSRKLMADKLKMAIPTLEWHLKNLRRKIGAESLYAAGCILSHYY